MLDYFFYQLYSRGSFQKLRGIHRKNTDLLVVRESLSRDKCVWKQEAALLVREGRDNEKFSTRPQGVWSTRAYAVVHSRAWYWTNFATALALMGLAVIEEPSVYTDRHFDRTVSSNFNTKASKAINICVKVKLGVGQSCVIRAGCLYVITLWKDLSGCLCTCIYSFKTMSLYA